MKSFGTILSEINGENWDKYTVIERRKSHIGTVFLMFRINIPYEI